MKGTFFVTRYHVASVFTTGAVIGMGLITCARQAPPPRAPSGCEQALIEPFLHRKPGDVTLGELRDLIHDLQACTREDTLFTDDTDLFGIGAGPSDLPSDAGSRRSQP